MGVELSEAVTSLAKIRNQLRSASQHAASGGDWGKAKLMMDLAERADGLREELSVHVTENPQPMATEATELPGEVDIAQESAKAEPPARGKYPRYWVGGGALTKQGLQRDGRDTYEHAVPRERFDEIAGHLADMAAAARIKQRQFTIDQVQQLLDCPRYMTYVVVSLLVSAGLVVRARKGSYRFSDPDTFRLAVKDLWDRLERGDRA